VKELTNLLKVRKEEKEPSSSSSSSPPALRVVDVGAGLLAMRKEVVLMAKQAGWKRVEYTAYEMNDVLVQSSVSRLQSEGYTRRGGGGSSNSDKVLEFHKADDGGVEVVVTLRVESFTSDGSSSRPPTDLIVGCCLADLYPPPQLVEMMMTNTTTTTTTGTLLYLPITFAGKTVLVPSLEEEIHTNSTSGTITTIPSDQHVMEKYHHSLKYHHEHNLDSDSIITTFHHHGATLLAQGPSHWHINRGEHPYLFECMSYFFGMGIVTLLQQEGYDVSGWVERHDSCHTDIQVANIDLLIRLPPRVHDLKVRH